MYTFMLAVTTAMMMTRPAMVTPTKEVEPLMICVQHVVTGSLLNKHRVILIRSTVVAVHNNTSVETIVIINIHMQNRYLAFAPNG